MLKVVQRAQYVWGMCLRAGSFTWAVGAGREATARVNSFNLAGRTENPTNGNLKAVRLGGMAGKWRADEGKSRVAGER